MRKRFRCALPGYDRKRWTAANDHRIPRRYMGLLKILPTDPPNPVEPHEDGCPGAWYRSAFVNSLHKYERLLTKSGFSENLLLSRCEDRLVLEAVQLYEREKLAARNHYEELMSRDR